MPVLLKSLTYSNTPDNKIALALFVYALGGPLFHLSSTLGNLVKFVSILFFLYTLITSPKNVNGWFRSNLIYTLFVVWTLLTTLRMFIADDENSFWGINLSSTIIKLFLGMEFIPCLLPLSLCVFQKDNIDFRYFNKIARCLLVVFLCFSPFAIHHMLNYEWSGLLYTQVGEEWGDEGTYGDFVVNSSLSLASMIPPIIMIYFRRYMKLKVWMMYLLTVFVWLFIYLYTARRCGVAVTLLYMFSCFCLYFVNSHGKKLYYLLFVGIVFYVLYSFYLSLDIPILELLEARGLEDTRSSVENSFYKDMDDWSWLIGRSWFGTYYDPLFRFRRSAIETGYLSLILRGGIIYFLLYLCVLIPAAFKGLFKSNNILIKSFAVMILISIAELYPYGWPEFSMKYYCVWLGAYVCMSKYYRNLTDDEVYNLYFSHQIEGKNEGVTY